jgi:hypothetical protein
MQPEEIQFENTKEVPEPLYESFTSGLYPERTSTGTEDSILYQPSDRFVKIWDDIVILKITRGDKKHGIIYFDQDGVVVGPLVNSVDERVKSTLLNKFIHSYKQIGVHNFITIITGKSTQKKYKTVDTAVSLASRTSMNYGHWMLEHLPKLIKANQISDQSAKVLMKQPKDWQSETLDLLGVPQTDRIYIKNKPIRVKKFIQTDIKPVYTEDFELCTEDYCTLSETMKSSIDIEESYSERIFVSRQHVGKRCVSNMDEIETVLQKYNFDIIHPEKMTIRQQIEQFHNAKVIMGPIESGLTNMIFSPDAEIYPIIDTSWMSGLFFALSQAIGHDWYPIYSKSTEIERDKPYPYTSKPNKNIKVNVDTLTDTLEKSALIQKSCTSK